MLSLTGPMSTTRKPEKCPQKSKAMFPVQHERVHLLAEICSKFLPSCARDQHKSRETDSHFQPAGSMASEVLPSARPTSEEREQKLTSRSRARRWNGGKSIKIKTHPPRAEREHKSGRSLSSSLWCFISRRLGSWWWPGRMPLQTRWVLFGGVPSVKACTFESFFWKCLTKS